MRKGRASVGLLLAVALAAALGGAGEASAGEAPLVVVVESVSDAIHPVRVRRRMARRLRRPVRSFPERGTAGAWAVLVVAVTPDGCRARLRLRTRAGRVFEALYRDRDCGRPRASDRLAGFAARFTARAERSATGGTEDPLPVYSELIDPWSPRIAARTGSPSRQRPRPEEDWLVAPMGELLDPFALHPRRPGSVPAALHEVADPWRGRGGLGPARRLTSPRRRLPARRRRRPRR